MAAVWHAPASNLPQTAAVEKQQLWVRRSALVQQLSSQVAHTGVVLNSLPAPLCPLARRLPGSGRAGTNGASTAAGPRQLLPALRRPLRHPQALRPLPTLLLLRPRLPGG